ncbi:MAG: bifunctional helix-turn-helix domain-containing protein/methylated-DNA--[protein]-cysteine S-methyltransferase [Pseudomonadota bacterium]
MAEAIAWIDAHRAEQPSLDDLAAAMGYSPAHFQRAFSAWVGVSPKRYLQYLTLEHARHLLADRFTLLDTAHEVGLSGPSRLHDLFLRWEAMTPGEYSARGKGLEIAWDWIATPFGEALAMATPRGLAGLAFAEEMGQAATMADMRSRWPDASYTRDPAAIAPHAASIVEGLSGRSATPLRLQLHGTPFQIKVWEALLAIPSGQVTTYSEIARVIGSPAAVRAVGSAVGRNPISWLIPCHRALRRDGQLGGYHWGLGVKRAMLAWEGARADARSDTASAAG